jgi:hypothetical protein
MLFMPHNDPRASEGRGIAFLTIDSAQSTKGIKKFEITSMPCFRLHVVKRPLRVERNYNDLDFICGKSATSENPEPSLLPLLQMKLQVMASDDETLGGLRRGGLLLRKRRRV